MANPLLIWAVLLIQAGCLVWLIRRVRDLANWQALTRRDTAARLVPLADEVAAQQHRLDNLAGRLPDPADLPLDTLTIGQFLSYRPDLGGVLIWLGLAPDRLGPRAIHLPLPEAARLAGREWPELRALLATGARPTNQFLQIQPTPPIHRPPTC